VKYVLSNEYTKLTANNLLNCRTLTVRHQSTDVIITTQLEVLT